MEVYNNNKWHVQTGVSGWVVGLTNFWRYALYKNKNVDSTIYHIFQAGARKGIKLAKHEAWKIL